MFSFVSPGYLKNSFLSRWLPLKLVPSLRSLPSEFFLEKNSFLLDLPSLEFSLSLSRSPQVQIKARKILSFFPPREYFVGFLLLDWRLWKSTQPIDESKSELGRNKRSRRDFRGVKVKQSFELSVVVPTVKLGNGLTLILNYFILVNAGNLQFIESTLMEE